MKQDPLKKRALGYLLSRLKFYRTKLELFCIVTVFWINVFNKARMQTNATESRFILKYKQASLLWWLTSFALTSLQIWKLIFSLNLFQLFAEKIPAVPKCSGLPHLKSTTKTQRATKKITKLNKLISFWIKIIILYST